jgi:hypothetical protein
MKQYSDLLESPALVVQSLALRLLARLGRLLLRQPRLPLRFLAGPHLGEGGSREREAGERGVREVGKCRSASSR